jgi:uncharacterized membrane protein
MVTARSRPRSASLLSTSWGRALVGLAVAMMAATGLGLALLWPENSRVKPDAPIPNVEATRAEVTVVRAVPCQAPGQRNCRTASARLLEGPNRDETAEFEANAAGNNALVEIGDEVLLYENVVPEGADAAATPRYSFADFERRAPLLWLALGFVAVVVVLGKWRGVRSLIGLAISLAVVAKFILPAILDGRDAVAVAVVGAAAVMLVTIFIAHGIGPMSLAAVLGTAVSLGLAVLLAVVFTDLANLSGLSSEQGTLLVVGQDQLSLRGLVLAGMVIAALGVLDDLTVSQASAVMALRAADPAMGVRALYLRALSVGRDHVAATVNTLVLAYVGASLPTVLLFTVVGTSFGDAVNSETVAQDVVATLVGSIGLIAAVPVTTALAAFFATRLPSSVVAASGAQHHH